MRIAAIDIGTNSIHMIVVQVRPDLSFEVIDREKEMVRLGAGGLDGRALTPEWDAGLLAQLLFRLRQAGYGFHTEVVARAWDLLQDFRDAFGGSDNCFKILAQYSHSNFGADSRGQHIDSILNGACPYVCPARHLHRLI